MATLSSRPRSLLLLLGAVAGTLLTAWGLWAQYVGIANVDPGSEIPGWLAFVFAVTLLAVGLWLLALVRSAQRRERSRLGPRLKRASSSRCPPGQRRLNGHIRTR